MAINDVDTAGKGLTSLFIKSTREPIGTTSTGTRNAIIMTIKLIFESNLYPKGIDMENGRREIPKPTAHSKINALILKCDVPINDEIRYITVLNMLVAIAMINATSYFAFIYSFRSKGRDCEYMDHSLFSSAP